MIAALSFHILQIRLLEVIRRRLENGEFTVRGLARQIGLSQPHLQNVLSGFRILTPKVGDALMAELGLSLADLVEYEELGMELLRRSHAPGRTIYIPILNGRLGPNDLFPDFDQVRDWIPVRLRSNRKLIRPALVELGFDYAVKRQFRDASFVLLEQDDFMCTRIHDLSWYAIRWKSVGYIRQASRTEDGLMVIGQLNLESGEEPEHVMEAARASLDSFRAGVLWAGEDPRLIDALDQSGEWLPAHSS